MSGAGRKTPRARVRHIAEWDVVPARNARGTGFDDDRTRRLRMSLANSDVVVSKYLIPLNRGRIEIPLDGGDGRVRTDDRRATLPQCA